ncbi:hypothetical protein HDK64DRAFT_83459 [Phyllosticta capitalensis]
MTMHGPSSWTSLGASGEALSLGDLLVSAQPTSVSPVNQQDACLRVSSEPLPCQRTLFTLFAGIHQTQALAPVPTRRALKARGRKKKKKTPENMPVSALQSFLRHPVDSRKHTDGHRMAAIFRYRVAFFLAPSTLRLRPEYSGAPFPLAPFLRLPSNALPEAASSFSIAGRVAAYCARQSVSLAVASRE